MNHPAPPTKLFREEAKTGAIECPACGAPITLRGFGGVEQVACAYCGTVCKPEDDGNLDVVQQAQRQHRTSMLPLHKRGTLPARLSEHGGGQTWEILGIMWREVVSDGVTYPWQEFLLFNPYQGYRWLIYQMSDGVWGLGGPLLGAPELLPGGTPTATWRGETYKHFTTGNARVTYVEGEFPWQVLVNDVAQANDYVCPPNMLSIEVQHGEDGVDVNFTSMQPIEPQEVWTAFGMAGPAPDKRGIHPAEINPYKSKFYFVAAILLFVTWIGALIFYSSARTNAVVYTGSITPGEVLTEQLEIGDADRKTTLEFELVAQGMNNSWAYAEVMLVDMTSEEAITVGLETDAWSGVDQGESWSEGTNPRRVTVGGVDGGSYLLQVQTQLDSSGDPADALKFTIRQDVPLGRYMFLPFFIIVLFPALNLARKLGFETKRWANSDHATSSWES
ncbi:DUF4178 domain-containing protein [Enhygromyxa salina]|uniref:DUF4178 domain-containing protein n=1 Tax=Enhygromyxa salina TaxID=215803 RepID=A0A2S9YDN8_9BACT|nr:DUF4178 domain-containing protein [Enhygromyxa salina]PRQ03229.1 hypothetical protein ENSA7_53060 [Enhygromyxa salina]